MKLYDLLSKRERELLPPVHVRFWVVGYNGKWLWVTQDSWHVLYKHNKPKRLRKK